MLQVVKQINMLYLTEYIKQNIIMFFYFFMRFQHILVKQFIFIYVEFGSTDDHILGNTCMHCLIFFICMNTNSSDKI